MTSLDGPQAPKKTPSKFGGVLTGIILALVLIVVVGGGLVWSFLSSPGERPGRDIEILIPAGTRMTELAEQLKSQNAITSVDKFLLLARYMDAGSKLQVGRFAINTGWNPKQILTHLVFGKPTYDRFTLPEGLTWWEVGQRLEKGGFVRFADFDKVVHDPAFLRHWGIPGSSAEGFLFPDTYLLMRPIELNEESAAKIAGRLVDTFWRRTASLWPGGKRPGPKDAALVERTVTLASIIEKETAVPSERARVSGVYTNRLLSNMLLQADPTIIYGIGPSFSGDIRRSDLDNAANLYNTYKHPGLPPGPICSPGLACIRAALNPEKHDYIFFVARGDSSHAFSRTLEEHNRNVRLYRRAIRSGDSPSLIPGGVNTQ